MLEMKSRKRIVLLLSLILLALASLYFMNNLKIGNYSLFSKNYLSAENEKTKLRFFKEIIADYQEVINEFKPVKFKRPINTEEACSIFTHLLECGYFRGRFRGRKIDSSDYHKELTWFMIPDEYLQYYGSTDEGFKNTKELSSNLKNVDRITFYKHVVKLIAPDKTVNSVKRWVAQNIAAPQYPPSYSPDPNEFAVDGVELIFIGLGQCGQVNRVLLYLLKFGLGQEARLIGTPGHSFVEWRPKGGEYQILDADNIGKAFLYPPISYENLIKDFHRYSRILDAKRGVTDFGYSPSSGYIQKDKGDAWYVYYFYDLDSDGKIVSKCSQKFKYFSIGRESCNLIDPKFIDSNTLEVTVKNCSILGKFGIYAWILPKVASVQSFPSYNWIKDVISFGITWIENQDEEALKSSAFTIKLDPPLKEGKYRILMATTKTGLDASYNNFFTLKLEE